MQLIDLISFIVNHPLNRDRRAAALWQALKWQIGSRLLPGEAVFDWVDGARFHVRRGETGLTGNIYTGLHEFQDMGFLLHFLRPDDFFVDIGANSGSYSILAGAVTRAEGIAFEPIPVTFRRLSANLKLNAIETRIEARNLGLAAENGRLFFTAGLDTVNHVATSEDAGSDRLEVSVARLDDQLAGQFGGQFEGRVPTLMKIDVEGFEQPVLQGAAQTLANPRLQAVILELNESGRRYSSGDDAVKTLMTGHGFVPYGYDPFQRALHPFGQQPWPSGNAIFLRDADKAGAILRAGRAFRLFGRDI